MRPKEPLPSEPGVEGVTHRGAVRPKIADYELLRLVGQGTYGDVWLARGLTGIFRAIKIVWRNRFRDAQPFEREFRGLKEFAAISQNDPGQMALLHVGQDESAGFFYYVMELADDAETGATIDPAKYVPLTFKELRARRGRLPADKCLRLAVELARALAGLHGRGLIHRDIKPSNVIMVNGAPKLADVGLVASATEARSYVGTEGFVPPEGPGTAAADVFAFGHLLYELLTGFDRRDFPRLPAELRTLPDRRALLELNQIILRACESDRARRYPDGAALLKDLLALQAGRTPRRQGHSWVLRLGVGAAAAAILVFGIMLLAARRSARPTPSPAAQAPTDFAAAKSADKSIAVLPFENQSDDKDNTAFFSDGMHEDILTNLVNISELRVVSRTSVMQYRGTTKKIRQIASELGVAYILEGSVRRAGNQVRITGQLIRAATDEHLWARSYDRELTPKEVFAIQAALSTEIVGALQAAISPETKKLLERRPTENLAAYDLYLKSRASGRESDGTTRKAREKLLQDAVDLDPNFAEAWGELAAVHAAEVHFGVDTTPRRLAQADAAIARAVRLAPDSPEIIRLLGVYASDAYHDFPRAAAQFEKVIRLQPNNSDAICNLGEVQRRQGRWLESVGSLRKAAELDPGNTGFANNLASNLEAGRRWDDALAVRRRVVSLRPDRVKLQAGLVQLAFSATGSTREADDWLARLDPAQLESPRIISLRKYWAGMKGDYAEWNRLDGIQPYFDEDDTPHWDQATNAAMMLAAHGDMARARARLGNFPAELRSALELEPANRKLWTFLSLMEALLGQKEEAQRDARKAVELMPEALNANIGCWASRNLAIVYAWTDDKDRAISELTRLFRIPFFWDMNVHFLRADAAYFPLRGDPRFEALLKDPKNHAPLF
ncbi:MAG: protein kinase [Verrucomicrobia bacterium]|nr:protein kinase [Verrucomicrobiota bacterium]